MNPVLFSLRPKATLHFVHQTSVEPHVPIIHTSYSAVSWRHRACAKAGSTLCLLWHTLWSREGDVALDLKWQFLGIICHWHPSSKRLASVISSKHLLLPLSQHLTLREHILRRPKGPPKFTINEVPGTKTLKPGTFPSTADVSRCEYVACFHSPSRAHHLPSVVPRQTSDLCKLFS